MYNFLRTAVAAPKVKVGDCMANAAEIVNILQEADTFGVQIMAFPELSITGASCGELFKYPTLINGASEAIEYISARTRALDVLFVVGTPILISKKVYNCALIMCKGEVIAVIPKKFFSDKHEKDIFSLDCCTSVQKNINFLGKDVPFGDNLIFDILNIPGCNISVEIGRKYPLLGNSKNSTIILNISAEHEYAGAARERKNMFSILSKQMASAVAYSSSGIGESVSDGVFSGHCFIAENGKVLAEKMPFQKDKFIVADIDVDMLFNLKVLNPNTNDNFSYIPIKIKDESQDGLLLRNIEKYPYLPDDKEEFNDFCSQALDIQSHALASRIKHIKAKKIVINVSGGLDSTLALLASAKATDILGAGRNSILALTLPGFGTSGRTLKNALALMKALDVEMREISIKEACLQHFKDIGLDPELKDLTYENAQARERTQIAMDIAGMEGGFMIGTGNMSELALGFTTYGGDHLSMYTLNAGLPKTVVRAVVRWVAEYDVFGEEVSEILLDILDTPISPELIPADSNGQITQITEDRIGPYELHDFFLYHIIRNRLSSEKTAFLAKQAFSDYEPEIIDKWLSVFIKRFFAQQFKRSCAPEGPSVLDFSLSPRKGILIPGDASRKAWRI